MKLFILEDDVFHQRRLESMIDQLTQEMKLQIDEQIVTSRPRELIEEIKGTGYHHLYFLDIDIKGTEKKGLEVAQEIRGKDPDGTIVFITTHSEFAVLTYQYKVAALDFIAKDQEDGSFKAQVKSALEYVENKQQTSVSEEAITFTDRQNEFRVPRSDIFYIETTSQPHKLRLIGKKQRIEFYAKLNEVEKKDDSLVKCHKSFVVNLENISRIDKKEKIVYFETGDSCFVSRRKVKELVDQLEKIE